MKQNQPQQKRKASTSTNSGGSAGNNGRAKATKKAGTKEPNTKDDSKEKTIYVSVSQEKSKAGEAKTTNQPADEAGNGTNATRADSAKIENGRHEPSETKGDKEEVATDKTQVDPALMNNIVEDLAKDTAFISQEDDTELITHEAEADQPQAQRDLGGENITQENNSANNEEVSEMV